MMMFYCVDDRFVEKKVVETDKSDILLTKTRLHTDLYEMLLSQIGKN